ncbi:MAG: NAD(P)H-hydrate dehydratase [Alphaproteobacteria bacterium]|nr:NAD(P)H-hydrate dehydratase [Alphaproteobacteria bacterium]
MSDVETLDRALLRRAFPLPEISEESDKEDRGRLLVIAGSRELAGAALLAGMAGLRAGAGKLQIATARSIAQQLAVAVPEARVVGLEETEEGCLAPSGIGQLLALAKGAQAVTIGCGLQQGPALDEMLDALLGSGLDTPLVLDAAVLGSLAPRADALRTWRGGATILPHSREMARLLDCEAEEVEADPLAAVRRAVRHFNVTSLVKGPFSHVAAPDGRAFRFEGGGVGLATSGSGDVLAGIVGGLAARGADPLTALLWGVWLHGEAGRRLTKQIGRLGFLARELPDEVPGLLET